MDGAFSFCSFSQFVRSGTVVMVTKMIEDVDINTRARRCGLTVTENNSVASGERLLYYRTVRF
jgi:hypothetical protein